MDQPRPSLHGPALRQHTRRGAVVVFGTIQAALRFTLGTLLLLVGIVLGTVVLWLTLRLSVRLIRLINHI